MPPYMQAQGAKTTMLAEETYAAHRVAVNILPQLAFSHSKRRTMIHIYLKVCKESRYISAPDYVGKKNDNCSCLSLSDTFPSEANVRHTMVAKMIDNDVPRSITLLPEVIYVDNLI